jgi:hypothetical protein
MSRPELFSLKNPGRNRRIGKGLTDAVTAVAVDEEVGLSVTAVSMT